MGGCGLRDRDAGERKHNSEDDCRPSAHPSLSARSASAAEQSQRCSMYVPVAGDEDMAVRSEAQASSPPVGSDPPCSLDDGYHRAEIVGLQAGFKDEVDKAGGEQAIGVAVCAIAGQLD